MDVLIVDESVVKTLDDIGLSQIRICKYRAVLFRKAAVVSSLNLASASNRLLVVEFYLPTLRIYLSILRLKAVHLIAANEQRVLSVRSLHI